MAHRVTSCRICGSDLTELWELGDFALCGHFPQPDESVPVEPMGLSVCGDCRLVQMHYRYEQALYGDNYGYRSGLNASMVRHLEQLAEEAKIAADVWAGDVVLDIGGNDGTLLRNFVDCKRVLMDPTAHKWDKFHSADVTIIPECFSEEEFLSATDGRKAQLILSVAMFYDLEDPIGFARQVEHCLDKDGLWVFEQSYLPSMVQNNSFDTICHEHLEYYSLAPIKRILTEAGLRMLRAQRTSANGGSLRVMAGRIGNARNCFDLEELDRRWNLRLESLVAGMRANVDRIKGEVLSLLDGGNYVGYGASTKGNTLLQYFGIDKSKLPYIVDINPDKYGCLTPGSGIPIIEEPLNHKVNYFVLPWHFRKFILDKEEDFMARGGKIAFPLPQLEVYGLGGLDKHPREQAVRAPGTAANA